MKNYPCGLVSFAAGLVFGFGFLSLVNYYNVYNNSIIHIARTSDDHVKSTSILQHETRVTPDLPRNDTIFVAEKSKLDKVRVFCWVMTTPVNLQTKAIYVKKTWGKRCTYTAFFSSVDDPSFPAIGLAGVKEGRDQLYEKTKAAFKYLWDCCKDDADWFMKADDDTYVIVENLKYMLKDYDPTKPLFFGRRFKPFIKQGYMSGGAGYVLSKEAVRRFVDGLESKKCGKGGSVEDVEMGRCMSNMEVEAMDTRDENGKETFFPLSLHHMVEGNIPGWFWKYIFYPAKPEDPCCSYRPITFHYVKGKTMLAYDYFIYGIKVQSNVSQDGVFYNNTVRKN